MRAPLSYVPLLPVTIVIVVAILLINPLGGVYPEKVDVHRCEVVVTETRVNDSGQHLTVEGHVDSVGRVKALLTLPSVAAEYLPGDSLMFSATLRQPAPRTRFENDYRRSLRTRGIIYTGFVSPDSIEIIGKSHNLFVNIHRLRPFVGRLLSETSLSAPAYEFLTAILTGDTGPLNDETRAKFASTGVAHVLALSGLHVGIIAGMISIALFPLYFFRMRRLMMALTILALWFYAVLTGLSPSVTRAVIMATAMSGGIILQRRYVAMNGLLLAACIILLFDPLQLYRPGFQLTFASVASILAIGPLLERFGRGNRIRFYFISMVAVSVAATAGTAILSAYHFHVVPVYFLIVNIPVLLVLPLILGLGVVLVTVTIAGIPSGILCHAVNLIYDLMIGYISGVGELPFANVRGVYFPAWICLPYFLMLVALIAALYRPRKITAAVALAMTAVTCCSFASIRAGDKNESEIFLTHDSFSTTSIYRAGNQAYLITNAAPANATALASKYNRRYSEYFGRHGVDSLQVAPSRFIMSEINRVGNSVTYKGRSYYLLSSDSTDDPMMPEKLDYLVVCRGFKGDVVKACLRFSPDSILLSNDLHPRRHDRYVDSLRCHDIPYRSLRRCPTIK